MPEKKWRTKEIAEAINVNPSTVQRWIKHFQLPCDQNPNGHFELSSKSYELIKHIHSEAKQGKKLRHISLKDAEKQRRSERRIKMVPSYQLDERMERLILQVDQLDRKLQSKADEVVEYQILHQRKEINELNDLVTHLNGRIKSLEEQLIKQYDTTVKKQDMKQAGKKRRLASIFSF